MKAEKRGRRRYLCLLPPSSFLPEESEPLKIDVIIIKKKQDVIIDKPIGHIFRRYNLVEFKSPADYLSVNDFYKVYGYACLYKYLKAIDIKELTVSYVETKYPRKVIKHLREEKGYEVTEAERGIYWISGDSIPMQIIETKRLSEEGNRYLNGLSNALDALKLQKVLSAIKGSHKIDTSAYRDVILRANVERVKEALGMGNLTLEQVIEETGLAARWEARGEAQGEARGRREEKVQNARNLKKIGVPLNQIAAGLELTIEEVIQA